MSLAILIEQVDALLPQTQCGLCGHEMGCKPYAQSIVENGEAVNKCVPGGQPVADVLAELLQRSKLAVEPSKWQVDPATNRPQEVRAVIIEDECIGCTKCIAACPVDAIIGSGKLMHTVFTDLCTGCELCLPPCPVDCILLEPVERALTPLQRQTEQNDLRRRYNAHLERLTSKLTNDTNTAPVVNAKQARITAQNTTIEAISVDVAKLTIEAAKLRTKIKRVQKQLTREADIDKQNALNELKVELEAIESRM